MNYPTFSRGIPAEVRPSTCAYCFEEAGLSLLPLQTFLLDLFQAPGCADNVLRYPTIGVSVPRQNGKTFAAELHALFCADALAAQVLFTTHRGKTARAAFSDLRKLTSPDLHPALAADVAEICRAQGHERITFRSGGAIDFATRSLAASRGESFNVVIIDEAQELTLGQQAAIAPTTLAAGAMRQTIFLGTPPGPGASGDVFRLMHDSAHDETDDAGFCWLEWAARSDDNISDREVWARTNPSLGPLITEAAIAEMLAQMKPESFRCEVLGFWAPLTRRITPAFTPADWTTSCVTAAPTFIRQTRGYGVKTTPEGAILAGALGGPAGCGYVELIDRTAATGLAKIASFLDAPKRRRLPVFVDGILAQSLLLLLSRQHRPGAVRLASSRDIARACVNFEAGIKAATITHSPAANLKAAAMNAARRPIGTSGGWGFRGEDAALLEACALALAAARETSPPREPAKLL